MDAEEPAWKAEVMKTVGTAERGSVVDLLTLLEPHIQAAEQRGRSAGIREVADHLESIEPIEFALGSVDAVAEVCRLAAAAESP